MERIVTHSSFYACSQPVKGNNTRTTSCSVKGASTWAAQRTVMTRRNFQAHHNTDLIAVFLLGSLDGLVDKESGQLRHAF